MAKLRNTIFFLALCLLGTVRAHAMAGQLRSPSIATPESISVQIRTNLLAVLSDKDCKFLDGNFINATTTLRYGGSTESLNKLIRELSGIGETGVAVTFTSDPGGPSWTIQHNGWGDPLQFNITVNVAAANFRPDKLQLSVTPAKSPLR